MLSFPSFLIPNALLLILAPQPCAPSLGEQLQGYHVKQGKKNKEGKTELQDGEEDVTPHEDGLVEEEGSSAS